MGDRNELRGAVRRVRLVIGASNVDTSSSRARRLVVGSAGLRLGDAFCLGTSLPATLGIAAVDDAGKALRFGVTDGGSSATFSSSAWLTRACSPGAMVKPSGASVTFCEGRMEQHPPPGTGTIESHLTAMAPGPSLARYVIVIQTTGEPCLT